jgi:hypothetical protein
LITFFSYSDTENSVYIVIILENTEK